MRISSNAVQALLAVSGVAAHGSSKRAAGMAEPPAPEPIEVFELPQPPASADTTEGACTSAINPSGTGCIARTGLQSGDFSPDGLHVVATATYVGAPAAPDPASIYSGVQFIMVKADGTSFPNGDAWKCITCGVPEANRAGVTGDLALYPQTFHDGTRALSGINIIDCGGAELASEACTPNNTHIYPLFLDDGSEAGLEIRELRLHPDNVHITWNSFSVSTTGLLDEFTGISRLRFNEAASRYDLVNTTVLRNPDLPHPLSVADDGETLVLNKSALLVGELRGWTGTGKEVTYVGYPVESCNIDVFAADLATGAVRRLTSHPGYTDPIAVSPNDQWQVVLDTRGTQRTEFMAALRTVPPVTDLITATASSSVRNNGVRRFFQPFLLDRDGDRGLYFGQQLNAAGNGTAGAVNDPNWNAGADPRWSRDGTKVAYYQWLAVAPACGGDNPLECEPSPYPDGRAARIMVAHLNSRTPLAVPEPSELEIPDEVPWGTKYTPGLRIPDIPVVPAGEYTLYGSAGGHANVSIAWDPATNSSIQSVAATYHDFSDDGDNVLTGSEKVTFTALNLTDGHWDWFSNLTSTGPVHSGTKVTSDGGFHFEVDALYNFFTANGTLVTKVDEFKPWVQPCNNC